MSAGLLGICEFTAGSIAMPVSFATDIRPLFRDSPDVDSMQGYGLDLSSYEEVRARASEIDASLADGSIRATNLGLRSVWRFSSVGWMRASRRRLWCWRR